MNGQASTMHFGEVQFQSEDVIHFPQGLPGFEALTRFLLIQGENYEPFKFLQSLDRPLISFPLLDPRLVKADYHLELSSEQQSRLQLDREGDGLVYCVVTTAGEEQSATINLFAPLVINASKMLGTQILLLDSKYAVDQPLLGSEATT